MVENGLSERKLLVNTRPHLKTNEPRKTRELRTKNRCREIQGEARGAETTHEYRENHEKSAVLIRQRVSIRVPLVVVAEKNKLEAIS